MEAARRCGRGKGALINQVGLQHTGGLCLGYAAAYAKTITTGAVHTWAEFDYNGAALPQ